MLPEHHAVLEEGARPVADQTLGEMYRASAHGLNELIATVSPTARALLAVYCYRRAHLASIGLAIAATCEKDDLTSQGGNAGAALFERSRVVSQSSSSDSRAGAAGGKSLWRMSPRPRCKSSALIKALPKQEKRFFVYVLGSRRKNDCRSYVGWTTDIKKMHPATQLRFRRQVESRAEVDFALFRAVQNPQRSHELRVAHQT